jgi:hypothetical protein
VFGGRLQLEVVPEAVAQPAVSRFDAARWRQEEIIVRKLLVPQRRPSIEFKSDAL